MNYFVLKPRGDDEDVVIDALPEGGPADWRFSEGEPLAAEFPKNARVRFSDNFPDGRQLLDFVNNISDVLIVSQRVRELFDRLAVRNIEYLPVSVLDHRGKTAGKGYFIANVLGAEHVIDLKRSDYVKSKLDDEISTINQLVVNQKGVSADAKLFRASQLKTLFLIRQDVLDELERNQISGFKTYPADGWDGMDLDPNAGARMLDALRIDAMDRVPDTIDEIESERDPAILDRSVRRLCDDFQVLAIASLLIDGKPEQFLLNLCRVANNWKGYLEHRAAMGWAQATITAPPSPLIAAMVAGHWPLAQQLAALCATGGKRPTDYDDEYLHAKLLVALVMSSGRRTPETVAAATALADVDQGLFASRRAVIDALLSGDGEALRSSFADAVADYGKTIEEQTSTRSVDPRKVEPTRYVWLEGLAMLRLADLLGLHLGDSYLYCPPLARLPLANGYSGDWTATFAR